jgi:hypothetical protein
MSTAIQQSQWTKVLTAGEIEAHFALTASVDAAFARSQRAFYEARTAPELRALADQAWRCDEALGFMLARSYAALKGAAL